LKRDLTPKLFSPELPFLRECSFLNLGGRSFGIDECPAPEVDCEGANLGGDEVEASSGTSRTRNEKEMSPTSNIEVSGNDEKALEREERQQIRGQM
jgi:hypothetical protein